MVPFKLPPPNPRWAVRSLPLNSTRWATQTRLEASEESKISCGVTSSLQTTHYAHYVTPASVFSRTTKTKETKFPLSVYIQVSQEEWTKFRESVPYVKIYRYNPKHLCPKLNGYGDKGQRKVWSFCGSTYCTWLA